MIQKIGLAILFCLSGVYIWAQNTTADSAQMADVMRSNGKIYVVVAVIVAIFVGVLLYLLRLDKKISKLEKETRV